LRKNLSKDKMDEHIIQVVEEAKPKDVEQLIKLVKEEFPLPEQEILARILYLQKKKKYASNRIKPTHHKNLPLTYVQAKPTGTG